MLWMEGIQIPEGARWIPAVRNLPSLPQRHQRQYPAHARLQVCSEGPRVAVIADQDRRARPAQAAATIHNDPRST
jgi:hypothetical protein